MADKINIELDDGFISKLYEMTDEIAPPSSELNLQVLKKQLYDIGIELKQLRDENEKLNAKVQKRRKGSSDSNNTEEVSSSSSTSSKSSKSSNSSEMQAFSAAAPVITSEASADIQKASEAAQLGIPLNYSQPALQFIDPEQIKRDKKIVYNDNGHQTRGRILIIDDLGVITYQLGVVFKRAGFLSISSKEIYDAIDKFKRNYFDVVIMDLFIPTEREGFILLEELKKISQKRNDELAIGVMSASTRKEHKQLCQKKGAAFYVEKVDDWQRDLFSLIMQYV